MPKLGLFLGYCVFSYSFVVVWQALMAPNEEVVGSIPHAGVVLTTIVHPSDPTMVGVLGPCCMCTSKSFGEIPCLVFSGH
jgi:hypothetical protein